jgi:hypothetical protein
VNTRTVTATTLSNFAIWCSIIPPAHSQKQLLVGIGQIQIRHHSLWPLIIFHRIHISYSILVCHSFVIASFGDRFLIKLRHIWHMSGCPSALSSRSFSTLVHLNGMSLRLSVVLQRRKRNKSDVRIFDSLSYCMSGARDIKLGSKILRDLHLFLILFLLISFGLF